ncbi:MAG: hypothetical protein LIO69_06110 [Oscillospiraceae bacterium]|nr:hypothetical protein [Oscillospiraceae bacterium]
MIITAVAAALLAISLLLFAAALLRASRSGIVLIRVMSLLPTIVIIAAVGINIYNSVYFTHTAIPYYEECIESGYFPDEDEFDFGYTITDSDGRNVLMAENYNERIDDCRQRAYFSAAAAMLLAALYPFGIYIIAEDGIYFSYKRKISFLCKVEKDRIVFYSTVDGKIHKAVTYVGFSIKMRKRLGRFIIN